MREIKFRAWLKDKNEMYQFDESETFGDHFNHLDFNYDYVLMQYTGLKDKNGTEIYEGDIVKWTKKEYTDCSKSEIQHEHIYYGEMVWFESMLGIKHTGGIYPLMPYYLETDDFEVIGNIYEIDNAIKCTIRKAPSN